MKIKKMHIALFIISLLLAFKTYSTVSQFKALPNPIFGGDYYYQQGVVEHILAGGNPMKSSSIPGGMPGYLPLFAMSVAAFATIFNLTAFNALIYFSVIVAFMMPITWALAFRNFVKNGWWAVIGSLTVILIGSMENPLLSLPILKYTEFTFALMFPLFLNFLYQAYKDFSSKNSALLAFFYSILTISHMVVFIDASIMLALVFGCRLISSFAGGKGTIALIIEHWKKAAIFVVISVPILLSYWYEPLFVYHMKMAYDRIHIDFPDFADIKVQVNFLTWALRDLFYDFSSTAATIKSLLFVFTVYSLAKNIRRLLDDKQILFLAALFVASLLATFSYFATEPILHINFVPSYMYWITIPPALNIIGIHLLDREKIIEKAGKSQLFVYLFISIVLIVLIFGRIKAHQESDRFFKNAAVPLPEYLYSLTDHIKKNTSVNDVFLTTKELGFMINSLTGRKLVTNRWVHQNDPFIDMSQRDIDAAIMLYGNNINRRLELMKQHKVRYLYWDANWLNLEYPILSNGKIGRLDPLIAIDTLEARGRLDKNLVKYESITTWIDPAVFEDNYRKYLILQVSGENYRAIDKPWEPQLSSYMEEVWSYRENERKLAVLYKIKE